MLSRYLVNATACSFDIFILQTWNTDVPQARVRTAVAFTRYLESKNPPPLRRTAPGTAYKSRGGPICSEAHLVGVSLIRNRRTPRPTIGPRRVLCRGAFL